MCVPSCKNLIPTSYINLEGTGCVRECAAGQVIDKSNQDKPKCALICPPLAIYIDGLTNSSAPVCVPSCKNLLPTAYIFQNGT